MFALEDLGRNEELRRKMEAVEASRVMKFAKIRDKNEELKGKLRDNQASFQALANDLTIVNANASVLESRARETKEHVVQEEFIMDATI